MKQFIVNSIGRLDVICWILVILFFGTSAVLFDGNLSPSLAAAAGLVVIMIIISLSIEVMVETLKNVKGLGTLSGFITNGPELVCLIVGLALGDILFAASTPLGSNFMNPVLLFIAAAVGRALPQILTTHPRYGITCILTTAGLAVGFYQIPVSAHLYWMGLALVATLTLFVKRPPEPEQTEDADETIPRWYLAPAVVVLVAAGYLLDPVVTYASAQSCAPKGVIGFFVLATLSSWPEFKTCLVLLRRNKPLAAILNITVSNITNIWLTLGGLLTYMAVS